jgi:Ca2+-binding EF-hand superfamily protein
VYYTARQRFVNCDTDNSGTLQMTEARRFLGVGMEFPDVRLRACSFVVCRSDLAQYNLFELLRAADRQGRGSLYFEEFIMPMKALVDSNPYLLTVWSTRS